MLRASGHDVDDVSPSMLQLPHQDAVDFSFSSSSISSSSISSSSISISSSFNYSFVGLFINSFFIRLLHIIRQQKTAAASVIKYLLKAMSVIICCSIRQSLITAASLV